MSFIECVYLVLFVAASAATCLMLTLSFESFFFFCLTLLSPDVVPLILANLMCYGNLYSIFYCVCPAT